MGVPGVGAGPRLAVEETELVVDGAVAERRLLCVGRQVTEDAVDGRHLTTDEGG